MFLSLDRGVPVFYSLGYFNDPDPYTEYYTLPLSPIIPPEPLTITTTTTTTVPLVTTTTTTTIKLTPGWHLAVAMLVLTSLISSRKFRKSKNIDLD